MQSFIITQKKLGVDWGVEVRQLRCPANRHHVHASLCCHVVQKARTRKCIRLEFKKDGIFPNGQFHKTIETARRHEQLSATKTDLKTEEKCLGLTARIQKSRNNSRMYHAKCIRGSKGVLFAVVNFETSHYS